MVLLVYDGPLQYSSLLHYHQETVYFSDVRVTAAFRTRTELTYVWPWRVRLSRQCKTCSPSQNVDAVIGVAC